MRAFGSDCSPTSIEIFQYGHWDLAAGRDIVPCLNPTYQALLPLHPNHVLSPDTSAHLSSYCSRTEHHLLLPELLQ